MKKMKFFSFLVFLFSFLLLASCGDNDSNNDKNDNNNNTNEIVSYFYDLKNSFNSTDVKPTNIETIKSINENISANNHEDVGIDQCIQIKDSFVLDVEQYTSKMYSYLTNNLGEEFKIGEKYSFVTNDSFLYYTITKTSSGFEIKSIDNELARLYKLKKNSDFYELEAIVSDGSLNGYFYCDSYYNCVYFDDNMIFTYISGDKGVSSTDMNVVNYAKNAYSSELSVVNYNEYKSSLYNKNKLFDYEALLQYFGGGQTKPNNDWEIRDETFYGYYGTKENITIPSDVKYLNNVINLSSSVKSLSIGESIIGINGDELQFDIMADNLETINLIGNNSYFKLNDSGFLMTKESNVLLAINKSTISNNLDFSANNYANNVVYRDLNFNNINEINNVTINFDDENKYINILSSLVNCVNLNTINKLIINNVKDNINIMLNYTGDCNVSINELILNGNYERVTIQDSFINNNTVKGVFKKVTINDNSVISMDSCLGGISSVIIDKDNVDLCDYPALKTLIIQDNVKSVNINRLHTNNNLEIYISKNLNNINFSNITSKNKITVVFPYSENTVNKFRLTEKFNIEYSSFNINYGTDEIIDKFANDFDFEVIDNSISINQYIGLSNIITIPEELLGYKITNLNLYELSGYYDEINLPKSLTSLNINTSGVMINKLTTSMNKDEFIQILGNTSINQLYKFTNQIICNGALLEIAATKYTYTFVGDFNNLYINVDFTENNYEINYENIVIHSINNDSSNQYIYLTKYIGDLYINCSLYVDSINYEINLNSFDYNGNVINFEYKEKEVYNGEIKHNFIEEIEKSSCDVSGYAYEKCSICNVEGSYLYDIPATGHSYYNVSVDATCQEAAHTAQKCYNCEYEDKFDYIGEPISHTYNQSGIVEPSCGDSGYYILQCSMCNITTVGDIIPATGIHEFDSNDNCINCINGNKLFRVPQGDGTYSTIYEVYDKTIEELYIPNKVNLCNITRFIISETLPNVKKIIIGSNIEYFFGSMAYEYISLFPSLEEIIVEQGNETYIVKDNILYDMDYNMIFVPKKLKGEVEILDGCQSLLSFEDYEYIEGIVIPSSVVSIKTSQFKNCKALKYAKFEGCSLSLTGYTFEGCISLEEVFLGEGILALGEQEFKDTLIKEIQLPNSLQTTYNSFDYALNLEKIIIGSSLSELSFTQENNALPQLSVIDTTNNNNFEFENGVLYEKQNENYLINYIVETISGELNIKEGVKTFGTVLNRENITKVTFPSTITSLYYYAVNNLNKLEEITINFSDKNAVYNKLELPDSVKKLNVTAELLPYIDYSKIEELEIVSGTKMDYSLSTAFTNLKCVTIPKSIQTLNCSMFYNANNLEKVNYLGTLNNWTNMTVSNLSIGMDKIYIDGKIISGDIVLEDVIELKNYTFYNNEAITSISLPNCTKINDYAIGNLPNLVSLSIPKVNIFNCYIYDVAKLKKIEAPANMLETIFNKLPGSIYSSLEEINITSGEVLPSNSISTEFNNITKITFPNELKKIEEYSITFSGERLVLPDEVLTVESYAICGTEALKTISFGSKVSLIKEAFVHNTTKLENIYVNENNKYYKSLDGVLYTYDQKKLIKYPENKSDESYTLYDETIEIEAYAFYLCENLKHIDLNNVQIIKEMAFYSSSLVEVSLPESLTELQQSAFFFSDKLETLEIKANITVIPESAFAYCALTSVVFSNTIKEIKESAFNSNKFTKLVIPDSVEILGAGAFTNNSYLKELYVSKNITEFTNSIPKQVYNKLSIPLCYFLKEYTGKDLTINNGDTLPVINEYLYDKNVTRLTLANSFTTIESKSLLRFKTNLEYLEVPFIGTSRNIGSLESMFSYSNVPTSLTEIVVNNDSTVTTINLIVVGGCNNINLTINEGIEILKATSGLASLNYKGSLTSLLQINSQYTNRNTKIYVDDEIITELVVPTECITIGEGVFSYLPLDYVEIGSHVTSIGDDAFRSATIGEAIIHYGIEHVNAFSMATYNKVSAPQKIIKSATDIIEEFVIYPDYNNTTLSKLDAPKTVTALKGTIAQGFTEYENLGLRFIGLTDITIYKFFDETTRLYNILGSDVDTITTFKLNSGTLYTNSLNQMNNIETIILDEGVTTIEERSISKQNITELHIPSTVTSIEANPIVNCSSFVKFTLSLGNTSFKLSNEVLYSYDYQRLIACPTKLQRKTIDVNSNTKIIGDYAFYYCSEILNITVPATLTTIGKLAFANATGFNELELSESVVNFGETPFSNSNMIISTPYTYEELGLTGYNYYINYDCDQYKNYIVRNDIKYYLSGNAEVITQSSALDKDVVIPTNITYNGHAYYVYNINAYSFNLTKVKSLLFEEARKIIYHKDSVRTEEMFDNADSAYLLNILKTSTITMPTE